MNRTAVRDSQATVERDAGSEDVLARHATLQDWRRALVDLYADVRALAPEAGHERWRSVRERLFREHPQSPLPAGERASSAGLGCFAYDPTLRVSVELGPSLERETLRVEAGGDGVVTLVPYALTRGLSSRLGRELTLYWIAGYGGGTFLPFGDATNGTESYGGGRYLLDTIKGADLGAAPDGRLILDFNFAYYPSCAYSPAWVCPLSPADNRLPLPVRGGERDISR